MNEFLHPTGLRPTADRRVARQPDQLQQPPQRGSDVQLAIQVGQPLARQLIPQERLQPVLGDRLEPLVLGQRTQRRLGIASHALVLGAQPAKRRRHRGPRSLVHPHSLGHQPVHKRSSPAETCTRPVTDGIPGSLRTRRG